MVNFSALHLLRNTFFKTIPLTFVFCLFYQISLAQLGAVENLWPGVGFTAPWDMELVDIDADGDKDVFFVTLNSSEFYWIENLGNGDFAAPILLSSNLHNPSNIAHGDLNNDGFVDMIVVSTSNDQLLWFPSNGDGTFSNQTLISNMTNAEPHLVEIDDVDLDNDLDLMVYSRQTASFLLFANTGNGTFAPGVTAISNVPHAILSCVSDDFDGDGLTDIAFGTEQFSGVFWAKNLGGGTFGPVTSIVNLVHDVSNIQKFDLDYDGYTDLIFCSPGMNGIYWIKNNGNGTFSSAMVIATGVDTESIGLGHIDDDGYVDIFYSESNINASPAIWRRNLQNGNWSAPFGFSGDSFQQISRVVSLDDLDLDGDQDLVLLAPEGVRWYENFFIAPNKISGTLFFDENTNGLFDPSELGMNAGNVLLQPTGVYSYPNSAGEYLFSEGVGTFTLQPQGFADSLWTLTTDTTLFVTTVLNGAPIENMDFGFTINVPQTNLEASITGSGTICSVPSVYWLDIQNLGTTKPSGFIEVELDDSVTFLGSSIAPDSINGQFIYWHFDSLFYFSNQQFTYTVGMPSYQSIGDTLVTRIKCHITDASGTIIETLNREAYEILLCAYDPNDKAVSPKGIGPEGNIVMRPDLEYTVRFQNTGNFYATNVMITDTLDAHLNWSSLRFLASSHLVNITVDANGVAKFKFNNIYLPDSTSNEPGSHGFIKFKIDLQSDVVVGDEIRNQVGIFFDFNPPVITNEVLNTIYTPSNDAPIGSSSDEIIVSPNPGTGVFSLATTYPLIGETSIIISDCFGRIVYSEKAIIEAVHEVDISDLRNGLYLIYLVDSNNKFVATRRMIKN